MDFTPPQQLSPFKAKQDDGLGIVEEKKTIIIRGRRFESSDRIGMASSWVPLSNAILNSSYVNNKLPIAVSMESHDNHEIKFEKLYEAIQALRGNIWYSLMNFKNFDTIIQTRSSVIPGCGVLTT